MIDFLKYKKSMEGPKIHQKSRQTAYGQGSGEGLKYIPRRDKVARLLVGSTVYNQPASQISELKLVTPQSPQQQAFVIPQEQASQIQEQQFITSFEPPQTQKEEAPHHLSVKMEPMSPSNNLKEEFSHSRSQQIAQRTNIHNDPAFEEKNYIKKHIDGYRQASPQYTVSSQHMYDSEDEPQPELPPKNVFTLSQEEMAENEGLNESFMGRLNDKFNDIYKEVNAKKPAKKRKPHQPSATVISPQREVAFVQEDAIKDSHLISSLMSPHASELNQLNQRSGALSTSVRDFRSRGEEPFATRFSSPHKDSEQKRGSSQQAKERKSRPSRKEMPTNDLFSEFEENFLLTKNQELDEAEKDQEEDSVIEQKRPHHSSQKRPAETNQPMIK